MHPEFSTWKAIFGRFGTIQLDSILAEETISSLELSLSIDMISRNEMSELGRGYNNYKKFFMKNIDTPLLQNFNHAFFTQNQYQHLP